MPFYLTSNPLIANQFSQLILAFLHDDRIDDSEPVYLFDLGAGSGRLGYLILNELCNRRNICYVMTDMIEENLKTLETHPQLQSFIEKGALDFSSYNSRESGSLHLRISNKEISPSSLNNPLIIIGTYFFDTIAHDLFRVSEGSIEEGRITLKVEGEDPKTKIASLEASYSYRKWEGDPSYPPVLNFILDQYTQVIPNKTPFLLPVESFEVIEYFSKLTTKDLLVLSADQGVASFEQLIKEGEPKIAKHASFSIGVNYHAMNLYFQLKNGLGCLPDYPQCDFIPFAGTLGSDENTQNAIQETYENTINRFSTTDFWTITELSYEIYKKFSLNQLLLLLKLGIGDPILMYELFPLIRQKIRTANFEELQLLERILKQVITNFYVVTSEEAHFIMNMGVLYFDLKKYDDAAKLFRKALEIAPSLHEAEKNLEICLKFC